MTAREIGLVVRDSSPAIKHHAEKLFSWAAEHGHVIRCSKESVGLLGRSEQGVAVETLVNSVDPIVTLGGDGTLIGVARYADNRKPTLLGVNFGRLGFLTEIRPEELLVTLEAVLKNEARTKERNMLLCTVERHGELIFSSQAVNDAVIQKGSRDKLLDLDVFIESEALMRLRADGLIVATPTGSTAYSLAANGSIVYPSLGVMLLTPICPHSLNYRPIILPISYQLSIMIPEYVGEVFVSIDGQVSCELEVGDRVQVTKAHTNVRFVRSPSLSYYDILRDKLRWGLANGQEVTGESP